MLNKPKKLLKWINPIDLADQISTSNYNENWVFLYSGLSDGKNVKSYICLYPIKQIISANWQELEIALKSSKESYFGYLGYGLKNHLEPELGKLTEDQASIIDLPNLWLINFALILEFNHQKKQVYSFGERDFCLSHFCKTKTANIKTALCKKGSLGSNFSKNAYLEKVKIIQNHIKNGDIYQANLTRKFFGELDRTDYNPFLIFKNLNLASPANYSSFLKFNDNYIISSSPELFLKINHSKVQSCPIKGTAKRFANKKFDWQAKQNLQNSPKEQAENLMIVDLVRNDLSRNCLVGSVLVKNLFKLSSYKTLHHLSSKIVGTKNNSSSNLEVVKSCFPAGSMTGAPKIKSIEICSELEQQKRGVYSGAIGFINQQNCKFSVVIRTLIVKENKFEFQVGGAITFDSNPEMEWQETINKSRGIAKSLKINLSDIRSI